MKQLQRDVEMFRCGKMVTVSGADNRDTHALFPKQTQKE